MSPEFVGAVREPPLRWHYKKRTNDPGMLMKTKDKVIKSTKLSALGGREPPLHDVVRASRAPAPTLFNPSCE